MPRVDMTGPQIDAALHAINFWLAEYGHVTGPDPALVGRFRAMCNARQHLAAAAARTGRRRTPRTAHPDQCRWALECHTPPDATVHTTNHGDVEACTEHAAWHAQWAERRAAGNILNLAPEPTPECWCPTTPRRTATYCPQHGTPTERGIDPDTIEESP